jgi:hypothetical protein
MSISDRTSPRKPSVPRLHFDEMTWLGAIALAIVAIHIVAALMMPASRGSAALLEDGKALFTD